MITSEPILTVGIMEGCERIAGAFLGLYRDPAGTQLTGPFTCTRSAAGWSFTAGERTLQYPDEDLRFEPADGNAVVRLDDVTIGVSFHWERKEPQTFRGALRLHHVTGKGITAINEVPLEEYLKSVISSEMSATAPAALLRAHAITSRSWLVAMLERPRTSSPPPVRIETSPDGETTGIVRWYTREDHAEFDVCADDHCQRYQGISKIIAREADEAVEATRGMFLVHAGQICDARFYKACGGLTEDFASAWEDIQVPYLRSVSDGAQTFRPVDSEKRMEEWIEHPPDAYCNTTDAGILRQVLPSFDQETTDFFRWTVRYEAADLGALIAKKSGLDLGRIRSLEPLRRGPSGRITAMRITGSRGSVTVGKELEIRRWLSPSHLYSSAFVVETAAGPDGFPASFTLRGAGWGHGVGLCQIGAAVMATRGMTPEAIVLHYFPGASLSRLY